MERPRIDHKIANILNKFDIFEEELPRVEERVRRDDLECIKDRNWKV